MFSKIESSFSNFNKYGLLNLLLLAFFVYFIYSYFLKLNYVFDRDETSYLSDSLLLIEGIRPIQSHSPSGISTWLGSIVVLIDFIINNFSFHNLGLLFENFDLRTSPSVQTAYTLLFFLTITATPRDPLVIILMVSPIDFFALTVGNSFPAYIISLHVISFFPICPPL